MSVPQKNSGNKNKGQSASRSNHETFINDFISELEMRGRVEDIYIGKIVKMLGNSRVEVNYQRHAKDGTPLIATSQAAIPGKFQGKNKRYFWIETGSTVLVADTGLKIFEVVGMIDNANLEIIRKHMKLHVFITGNVDEQDELFEKAEKELDIDDI
jgi:translation initiation factor IF-1